MLCSVGFAQITIFSHENIIKYAGRPFSGPREMDDFLLSQHNDLVKPEDHVSFLGDVTLRRGGREDKAWFTNLIRRFNGHKRLFLGNHDHFPIQTYIDAGFEKIYATWRDETSIIYSHIPLHPRQLFSVKANVHGHIHQNLSPAPFEFIDRDTKKVKVVPYINVSVENTSYGPITHDQILARIDDAIDAFNRHIR